LNQFDREQMQAALRDMAILTKDFYDRLIAQGFTPIQAIQLTGEFVRSAISK